MKSTASHASSSWKPTRPSTFTLPSRLRRCSAEESDSCGSATKRTPIAAWTLWPSRPARSLQNVLLLSGGEKALAALALLIAIFRYTPSPFCVLDEVDAPLDDTNVERFTRLVHQMSRTSQFILITHNKRTMEIASAIYGVTMESPGVSKLVSVKLEDVEEPVEVPA